MTLRNKQFNFSAKRYRINDFPHIYHSHCPFPLAHNSIQLVLLIQSGKTRSKKGIGSSNFLALNSLTWGDTLIYACLNYGVDIKLI